MAAKPRAPAADSVPGAPPEAPAGVVCGSGSGDDGRRSDAVRGTLRARAEQAVRLRTGERSAVPEPVSLDAMQRALHDLQVHQIELEMQSDELQRSHDALDAALAKHLDHLEHGPVGYVTFSEQGVVTEANLKVGSLLGIARGAVIGQPFSRFVFPADQDTFYHYRRQLRRVDGPQACEVRMVRGDGTSFWARVEGTASASPDGTCTCRAVLSDVTAHVDAEAALRNSEERYRLLVATSLDGVLLIGADGGILAANDAACQMCGWSEDELTRPGTGGTAGVRVTSLVPALADRSRAGRLRGELTFVRRDQTTFVADVSSAVFTDASGQERASLVIRDVSDRKQAEEAVHASRLQLRALAARLQDVREEERTRVAREIHDVLAQELTRLKIDLVWLHGRLSRAADLAAASALAPRVLAMSQMADATIHSVQRIATELRPAVLDSLGLCAAVEWHVRDVQARSAFPCQADVPAEELPASPDVATAAFRILQESLTNVVRHANAGRVDVRLCRDGESLRLTIHDDGCGIPADAQANPLSIGLAGMRERALLLGGQFEVVSEPGAGTTIDVRLPLSEESAKPGGWP